MSTRICPDCEVTTDLEACPQCGCPTLDQTPFLRREDPLIGKLVAGRYRVQSVLGSGGMGKVYLAEQIAMKRQVALKVIRTQESGDMSQKMSLYKRFQREAMAASRLEHPNTVRVFDFGMAEDGTLFLAMELLRGITLARLLQSNPIPLKRTVRIAVQICRSLAEAHEKGIVHRDLKPDNIMISDVAGERDFVKILDFGIAKITAETGESSITRTGMIMGTPAYMAPEQATGAMVGPATDLYALGVILYEAISGRPPFSGETPLAILIKHANEMVPRLVVDGFPPDVPQDLVDIVYNLLEKKPGLRPGSAIAVAKRLEMIDFGKVVSGHANHSATTIQGLPGAAPGAMNLPPVIIAGEPANPIVAEKAAPEEKVVTTVSLPTPGQGTGYMYVPTDPGKIFSPFGSDTAFVDAETELPAGAQVAPEPTDPEIYVSRGRGRKWMLVAIGVLLLGVAGVAAVFLIGNDERPAAAAQVEPVKGEATVDSPAKAVEAKPAVEAEPAVEAAPAPIVVASPVTLDAPIMAAPVPPVAPVVQPAKIVSPAPAVNTAEKSAPKARRTPTRPQLPGCVRSSCPISGDCLDRDGRRVNGKSFCGDLAL